MDKTNSLNASKNPSSIIWFLLKFISNGVDISISLIEKLLALTLTVEKKIFSKARKQKWIYSFLKVKNLILNFIKHINE